MPNWPVSGVKLATEYSIFPWMKPSMLMRTALAAVLPEAEGIVITKRPDRAFDFICCFIWR